MDEVGSVQLLGEREDRRGLAGAGRPVEEHVWEVGRLQRAAEDLDGVVLRCDFGEGFGPAVEGGRMGRLACVP